MKIMLPCLFVNLLLLNSTACNHRSTGDEIQYEEDIQRDVLGEDLIQGPATNKSWKSNGTEKKD